MVDNHKDWIQQKMASNNFGHLLINHSLYSIQEDEKESSYGLSSKFTPEFNSKNWMTLINAQDFTPLNKKLLLKLTPNTDIKRQKKWIVFNT